ncbi:MAG: pyruvate ferredoxin oxidoreductase [Prevotellaceae bacterium]|nr:pyruvate ferredoxin oxidoreductase [Prevotellaceae bacterium]
MDYKYIEQLLERYWDCETTNEEESILRTFFSQKDVPARLLKYRSLFEYQKQAASEAPLGDDFDQKVLAAIYEDIEDSPKVVKAKVVSFGSYLKPLFKAAAVVAMVLTIGDAAQWSMGYTSQEPSAQQMMAADTATIDNGMVTAGVDQTIADSVAVKSLKTMSDSIKPEIAVDHNIR